MSFLKEHLLNDHYSWNNSGNSLYTGNPSRRPFNRFDGDQVLFIINSLGSLGNTFTLHDGRRIEEMICRQLPLEAKSEMTVFHWLRKIS